MILTLVKLGLLLLSYFGWWEFFRGRCRLNVYFAPAFTVAAHFTLLFLPGLLNLLLETAWVLYLGGFVMLGDALRREKLGFAKHYINFGYGLMLAVLAIMALALRGKIITWSDNFTHWATVVKNMLAADQFPTFAQEAVTFTTYPLGSSAIIWYFSRFTSREEDFWMLAQGFMMLTMLLPMFAYDRKKGLVPAVFLAITGNFLLCYNIPMTELLVDSLLPLGGVAAMLFVHHECLRDKEPLDLWYALPLLLWIMNVKNAGTLFTVACVLILVHGLRKQGKNLKIVWVLVLVLLASYILWEKHCDYVFYNRTVSQHEISLEYFKMRLSDKTLADCWKIMGLVLREMVLRKELAVLLGLLAVLWALTWGLVPERKQQLAGLTVFLGAMFVVYTVSLGAMYISSMSLKGALELQSSIRYVRIWEHAAFYLLGVYGVSLMGQTKSSKVTELVLIGAMTCSWICVCGEARSFLKDPEYDYGSMARVRVEAVMKEYGVEPGRSYLLCTENEMAMMEQFLWVYNMDSSRVLTVKVAEEAHMAMEKYYDYVVILDRDNPVIEKWVAEHYPNQVGQTVIQCFK